MAIAIITGAAGLVGAEASRKFADKGFHVVGIDNDMRSTFFGKAASTAANLAKLKRDLGADFEHIDGDIRDVYLLDNLFYDRGSEIAVVVHTAAQPSHDWAATSPKTDFAINATGTLNLLDATKTHTKDCVFIYMSTNKVYGDTPNSIHLKEETTRYEPIDFRYQYGIDESMSIDMSTHSLFGVSKLTGDLLVQEYGRYFGLRTVCFRAGCITGAGHSGAVLHGFLAYLVKCYKLDQPYTIFGYGGKQVRDNIDASDLANAFWEFYKRPHVAQVFNIGGGRENSCSVIEAISLLELLNGKKLAYTFCDEARKGDHQWWITNNHKFKWSYPQWKITKDLKMVIQEMLDV